VRRAMGEKGRRLVEAKYRWESVARDMCRVYEGLLRPPARGADAPRPKWSQ